MFYSFMCCDQFIPVHAEKQLLSASWGKMKKALKQYIGRAKTLDKEGKKFSITSFYIMLSHYPLSVFGIIFSSVCWIRWPYAQGSRMQVAL